jgi:hypothetical protein
MSLVLGVMALSAGLAHVSATLCDAGGPGNGGARPVSALWRHALAGFFVTEVKKLGRHLPVLGGALGVVVLSAASIGVAEHFVRQLLGNGGDVTALISHQLEMLAAVSVKATGWGEQVLTYIGVW